MDEELKEKWIAALRSGKYEQGKEKLHCDGKFCCLGVLADIVKPEQYDGHHFSYIEEETGEEGLPKDEEFPDWFLRKIKMHPSEQRILMSLNDGYNWNDCNPERRSHTFAEIADYIEANL